MPLLSQQSGVPPSIEQLGTLSESAQLTVPLQVMQLTMPLVQKHPLLHALQPEDEELLELEEEELVEVKHMKLELQSVPVLSQQRGVPPSIEQVGDLLASAQPIVSVQPVH